MPILFREAMASAPQGQPTPRRRDIAYATCAVGRVATLFNLRRVRACTSQLMKPRPNPPAVADTFAASCLEAAERPTHALVHYRESERPS